MSIDVSRFFKTFFEETSESIEVMEAGLLRLQVTPDHETIDEVFRAAHSVKGSSGSLGFTELAGFTHFMETLLDEMRAGKRLAGAQTTRVLLDAVDCLREMIAARRDGLNVNQDRMSGIIQRLQQLLAVGADMAPPEKEPDQPKWRISFRPLAHLFCTGNDPVRLLRELRLLGELTVSGSCSQLPALETMSAEDCYLSWDLFLVGNIEEIQIREVFEWVESDCDLTVERLAETAGTPGPTLVSAPPAATASETTPDAGAVAASGPAPKGHSKGETASLRVSTDKVDAIINLVGELVITQSMLNCFGEQFDMSMMDKLRDGLALLARNTRELQETVLKIRMLPISFTFNRFPRLVHDLSEKLEKKIVLKMSGEQTELDKTVLEKITDPLTHLLRNSLDHGIEKPEVRRAAGKQETGTIHMHAAHQGGSIVIEIRDDGAGLNTERILAKARERGLVGAEERLPEEKIHELIFAPGFSTADAITDISGRGVGMDVVRRNIKELGGNIEIRTQAGLGTTFRIRLPLTLAILDGQLVRVADQIYVIPLVSIVESLQIKRNQVSHVAGGGDLYHLRDQYIPIVRLYEVFHLKPVVTRLEEGLLVVIEAEGQQAGIFVDDLLAQQQVVIKSLESNFRRVEGISGATILGDGTVSIILDVPGILRIARMRVAA